MRVADPFQGRTSLSMDEYSYYLNRLVRLEHLGKCQINQERKSSVVPTHHIGSHPTGG